MTGRTDRRLRLLVLLAVFLAMGSAVVVRLSYWQLSVGTDLRRMAADQLVQTTEIAAVRGDIVDRRGTVLATTSYRDLLAAYPERLDEPLREQTVAGLTAILGLDEDGSRALRERLTTDDPYVVLVRSVTPQQSERIRAGMAMPVEQGGLAGLALRSMPVREYPNPGGAPGTTLASQLLGFVTEDGKGHYGIEDYYDEVLAGVPTQVASLQDGALPLSRSGDVTQQGQEGADVRLTIDASLQLQLEKELYAAWVADRAKRVSAVVLDPHSGEVLAWASVPGYDANRSATVAAATPELLIDPIASAVYEPGSVMKMVTAAMALESGAMTLDQEVRDSYALRFGNQMVRNADHQSKDWLPFRDAIAFSRNVATARVALGIDGSRAEASTRLYGVWSRFGIGQPTGIDLATESGGIAPDPSQRPWEAIDLANRAFGQGVAITQIQLAVAYAAMANGGLRVTPHLVTEVGGQPRSAPAATRAIETGLAAELHGLLGYVTQRVPWYRAATQIPGYVVGGKTGTAQIWDAERGGWLPDRFNFSFAGFVGAEQPEAIIVTRIEDAAPTIRGQGLLDLSIESYELFRRIAGHTLTALDVAPLPAPPAVQADPTDRYGPEGSPAGTGRRRSDVGPDAGG